MVSRFLHKLVIPMIKLIEGIITILELFVFCAHTVLLIMAICGVPYQVQDTRPMYWQYMSLWGLASLEVLLAIIQRLMMRAVKTEPDRLKSLMSSQKAAYRLIFRGYVQPLFWLVLIFIADEVYRKWLGDAYPGGSWEKYVSSMNFQIPFTLGISNLIHFKLWTSIPE